MLPVKSSLLPSVSRFFDDDWSSLFDWTNHNFPASGGTLPSVNVMENENDYILEMAVPGMKKDDFEIEVNNNVLTIKSESKNETEEKIEDNYTRREFSYRAFQRSFNLNNKVVNDAKINATYQDGILRVTLPKNEDAKPKPTRKIVIS